MLKRFVPGVVLGVALATAGTVLGSTILDANIHLDPGHRITVDCTDGSDYVIAGATTPDRLVVRCPGEPAVETPSPTVAATPAPTVVPTPDPTVAPTAVPTPVATAVPTASPTPDPTPDPTPVPTAPPATGEVVGYGAGTTGGEGGQTVNVSSLSALRDALTGDTAKTIILPAARQTWDLNGTDLKLNGDNKTLIGGGVIFKGGSVKVIASNIILRNVSSHAGDETGNADDVDAFTVNGNAACIHDIVLDRVEGIWGPDVGGLAILGCVQDMTVQYSILGEGLIHSAHSESGDFDGHGLAFNIASEDSLAPARRITVYGSLVTTSQSRQPRIIGGECVDIVDSTFYGFAEGPQGNSQSLNLIGNTWKKGSPADAAGFSFERLLWRYQPGGHGAFVNRLDNRVFISGENVVGYTPATPSGDDAAVLASSPVCAPSVASVGAGSAYSALISGVGPNAPMSDQTARLRSNVANGTGTYFNGSGYPGPNPTWP